MPSPVVICCGVPPAVGTRPDVAAIDVVGVRAVVEHLAVFRQRPRRRVLDDAVGRRQQHRRAVAGDASASSSRAIRRRCFCELVIENDDVSPAHVIAVDVAEEPVVRLRDATTSFASPVATSATMSVSVEPLGQRGAIETRLARERRVAAAGASPPPPAAASAAAASAAAEAPAAAGACAPGAGAAGAAAGAAPRPLGAAARRASRPPPPPPRPRRRPASRCRAPASSCCPNGRPGRRRNATCLPSGDQVGTRVAIDARREVAHATASSRRTSR